MSWIVKILNKLKDTNNDLTEDDINALPVNFSKPSFTSTGIKYANKSNKKISEFESILNWACSAECNSQQALYLAQLCDEKIATIEEEAILISWEYVYYLNGKEDHLSSIPLLLLPTIKPSTLNVDNRGTLSDKSFQIRLNGLLDKNLRPITAERLGAVFNTAKDQWLMSSNEWIVVKKINAFNDIPFEDKTRKSNEYHWGEIRPVCLKASVSLSKYLKETVVITKDSLDINFFRSNHAGVEVVAIEPTFEEAPKDWITVFDRWTTIPEDVDFPTAGGRIQIILSEPVRKVLTIIKSDFPFRRATGSRAEAFIRNPFAFLGEGAHEVLKEPQIEEAKQNAGIVPTSIRLYSYQKDGLIYEVVVSITKIFGDLTSSTNRETINKIGDLEELISSMKTAVTNELQFFTWRTHIVDVDGDLITQIYHGESYLKVWKNQANSFIHFEDVYSLENYGSQIEGIGEAKPIYSPYIQKSTGPWTPDNLVALIKVELPPSGTSAFIQLDMQWVDEFEKLIATAEIDKLDVVVDPRLPLPLTIEDAKILLKDLRILIGGNDPIKEPPPNVDPPVRDPEPPKEDPPGTPVIPHPPKDPDPEDPPLGPGGKPPIVKRAKETLLLKDRIGHLDYSETELAENRAKILQVPDSAIVNIPFNKRPEIELKAHQIAGVKWLQYLFKLAPHHARGALLADDMGLGKTLQLLTFIASHYEKHPNDPPTLIVAPIALMRNWQNEAAKFFNNFPEILPLFGKDLDVRKQPKAQIDESLKERKISNLLRPNWLGTAKVVLATYEGLRDYEFSLARQEFVFMICDEAQKIKTPNALVTLAAKKQKARFRIACTGTPVENSLADLWCLFDFVQPGLLGSLEDFGKKYRRPIETKVGDFQETLSLLKTYIEPQILRRMKTDKAIIPDLPEKQLVTNDSYHYMEQNRKRLRIPISTYQLGLYEDGLRQLEAASLEKDGKRRANISFAVLHFIKAVCAEPYCLPSRTFQVDTGGHKAHLFNSPKLKWTLEQLNEIAAKNEKAIIFTEIREIQRALVQFINSEFGFTPLLINGDTDERQDVIDAFQSKPGFGVIILSPLAAGFGLNIVEANHVIHYSRTWNPAKEGQATDRAYRIGQKRKVYVYCPTVVADSFETFEDKLDRLMTVKADLAGDMLDGVGAEISISELFPITGSSGKDFSGSKYVDMDYVDRLDGDSFEIFCKLLLGQSALNSEITKKGKGDGGIDVVIINYDGTGMLCQCKHTSSAELGWDAVKEVAAGSQAYQMRYTSVRFQKVAITNKSFNQTAKEQALNLSVRLIEREEIIGLLKTVKLDKNLVDENILKYSK